MARTKVMVWDPYGNQLSGYNENGLTYLDDGSRIRAGYKTADTSGRIWEMGKDGKGFQAGTISDFIKGTSATATNSFNDDYLKTIENQRKAAQAEAERIINLGVEQGVNNLSGQKGIIEEDAVANAKQAYIVKRQNERALPQTLATQGITGGGTETAKIALDADYGNNINFINTGKTRQLGDIDSAITNLKTTGNLQIANAALENSQSAVEDYKTSYMNRLAQSNWEKTFNQGLSQQANENAYRDKIYDYEVAQNEAAIAMKANKTSSAKTTTKTTTKTATKNDDDVPKTPKYTYQQVLNTLAPYRSAAGAVEKAKQLIREGASESDVEKALKTLGLQ